MKKSLFIFLFALFINSGLQAQLPNGGMENYVFASTDTLPADWSLDSYYSSLIGRSSTAHSGSFSFAINTWYHYSPGMMVNGTAPASSMFYNWPQAGTPISSKPARLTGYYMYTDTVNGDSAIVQVLLKKYNTVLNKIDTVAIGKTMLPFSSAFAPFQVDLADIQVGVQPDSVVVFFMSYDYLAGTQLPCVDPNCRYLWVDDLALEGTLSIKQAEGVEQSFTLFTQENQLHIFSKKNTTEIIELFTTDGKLVFTKPVSPGQNTVDVSAFGKGIYFARMQKGTLAVKWVKY